MNFFSQNVSSLFHRDIFFSQRFDGFPAGLEQEIPFQGEGVMNDLKTELREKFDKFCVRSS